MKIEMNLQGADGVLKTLKALPPEVVAKRGGPVKLSLAKGARFIRDKAKVRLRAAIEQGGSNSTGLLEANVISSRGKAPIGSKGERYLVRVRRKVYPNRNPERDGKVPSVRKSAQLMEYGSKHQPATPYLRPTVQQDGQQAINIITDDLVKRTDKVVKKLAQQNKGK